MSSQSDDDASSDVSEVFSDFESDSDSTTDLELDNEVSDSVDNDPDDDSHNDEGQLSPEHYLAQAESLNVSRLRQKQYADGTQEKLDDTTAYWNRYCRHIGIDPALQWKTISDSDETVRFLYGFFAWRCDICHGKNSRHSPCLRTKSLLETFWKLWHLVLKQETASGLCKETICKVIALVAQEKELELTGRPKKNMYIEDVAEFARVLLTTIEMTFACSWQRIQMLFFCQLAAYTASRPGALLHLCYQDIGLKLIWDPEGGQPWLNEFKIPEIIFDPSLVLSPHVCLLSMLFHIQGFKRLSKTGPQELLLKDELSDKFVFCQVERKPTGYQIILEKKLTAAILGSSGEVTDALQNVILQHADIRTFVRHYEVDVDVDVQGIGRKTESQTPLVWFACSFSASIDQDRPFRLSAEESKSLNKLPVVLARQEKLQHANMAASHCVEDCKPDFWLQKKLELLEDWTMEARRRYNIAIRELPGKLVNTKVMNTLEHKSSMAPQYLAVIDTLLTMPGTTLEAESQRRIDAINALTAFCPVEKGRPIPRTNRSCRRPVPDDDDETGTPVKRQRQVLDDDTKIALRQAMEFVTVKDQRERPTTCFLCLGNPNLPLKERTVKHTTPGSLTRHFLPKHINPPWPARGVECNVCGIVSLAQKADLLNHAEVCHGTVVRGRAQGELAQAFLQFKFYVL
ncbi:hypothetical protein BDW62DRAFT_218975 [Aspergillus aurantiobrunneus]